MRPLALLVIWLIMAGGAQAQFTPDPSRRNVDLPPDRNGPVPVKVDFFLLDVASINGANESFSAALYFDLKWKDSRMAFDAAAFGAKRVLYTGDKADEQLGQMWSPNVDVANLTGEPQVIDKTLTIFADGQVEYEVRLAGDFSSDMDLRSFPFDTQRLNVQLESFVWNTNEMKLVAVKNSKHVDEKQVIHDWTLSSVSSSVTDEIYVTGDGYSRLTSTIEVRRSPWFYIWSGIFPLVIITFFAVLCFFWDQESLTERIAQALTCMLTATAQNFALSDDLPKISYFTKIDYAFLLTYIVLLIVAVESIFAKFLNERNHALADHIDYTAAKLVSIGYIAGMILVFWPF